MSRESASLRTKVESFIIDDGRPCLSFARRLAREHGWTLAHAERVIREYKRFAILAIEAGHVVTPSEEVDHAWHLHLTYTHSYWKRFCTETLGRELHHHPTRGGRDEAAKHEQQYTATLASYRRIFGEAPPADIWPRTDFTASTSRWIDASSYWIVPKPSFFSRPKPVVATATLASIVPIVAVNNPFDWAGPTFLSFFAILAGLALLTSLALRFIVARDMTSSASANDIHDPYEAAYLAGGPDAVVKAALTTLVTRGNLQLENGTLSPHQPLPSAAPLVEQALYNAIPEEGTDHPRTIGKALSAARAQAVEYRNPLRAAGLVAPDPEEPLSKRWLPAMIMAAVTFIGLLKICVGLSRDRAVGFLVLMTIATAITAALFVVRGRLTSRGIASLEELKQRHRHLKNESTTNLAATDAALMAALFGTYYFAGTELMPIHDLYRKAAATPGADAAASSGYASDGGAGCGGGDCGGGCGAGGCGGGGCGGCGG